jgi:hypothetical protein
MIGELGYVGGQTILDVYLRELRPLFAPPPRTFQRTLDRPGEICQFDVWQLSRPGAGRVPSPPLGRGVPVVLPADRA